MDMISKIDGSYTTNHHHPHDWWLTSTSITMLDGFDDLHSHRIPTTSHELVVNLPWFHG